MSWDWEKLKQQQQGKGGVPPQMDEFVEKIKKVKFPGGPLFIVVIALVALAATSVFTVKQNEVGVVQLFGRYVRTTEPGLNFKLPLGIEKVTKVNVREIQTAEFGFSTTQVNLRTRSRTGGENQSESLMLTGDLNVAIVPWIVQYRVKNPFDYLFKVRDVRRILRDMSEATMRLVVGDRSNNEVISKRDEIAVEAKGLLQTELDQAESRPMFKSEPMMKPNISPRATPKSIGQKASKLPATMRFRFPTPIDLRIPHSCALLPARSLNRAKSTRRAPIIMMDPKVRNIPGNISIALEEARASSLTFLIAPPIVDRVICSDSSPDLLSRS